MAAIQEAAEEGAQDAASWVQWVVDVSELYPFFFSFPSPFSPILSFICTFFLHFS